MILSRHASMRMQQRGIPESAIDIIAIHGRVVQERNGAERIYLGRKESETIVRELKKMIREVERARGGSVIVNYDKIVTVYKDK